MPDAVVESPLLNRWSVSAGELDISIFMVVFCWFGFGLPVKRMLRYVTVERGFLGKRVGDRAGATISVN